MIDDVGFDLHVFDKGYQGIFTAGQPFKVEYKFDGVVLNEVNGYALVLKKKLRSVISDEQRHFDLI